MSRFILEIRQRKQKSIKSYHDKVEVKGGFGEESKERISRLNVGFPAERRVAPTAAYNGWSRRSL